ncbi:hypothetical protein LC087_03210 [Bacillus carboniphilus]|uniref:Uncharacterized protein n=1 Tax=Bacillus carboniphilus TaxID=86663 RepID=A0ABY9K042_9BACI|nr:hypothetical protein [Bacillus carboniphilus]WLR43220.1 hypothetical protein LC087_03210 [Bacillus carboniphilus]
MNKKRVFSFFSLLVLIVISLFIYQRNTDETYQGMSIIPEHHNDIPLYKGLEPTRNEYVIDGEKWEDIYNYYLNEIPKMGWKVVHEESALDDNDPSNDWSGFISTWKKDEFEGVLWISAGYNQYDEKTEVKFDSSSK